MIEFIDHTVCSIQKRNLLFSAGFPIIKRMNCKKYRCKLKILDLKASEPSLPCQREGDRVSGGGIRSTRYEFAGTLGDPVHSYRRIPRK